MPIACAGSSPPIRCRSATRSETAVERDPYDDGLRFWIHFAFGVLIGAAVGASVCVHLAIASASAAALVVVACALVVGYVGARGGDRFWHWLLPRLRWFS